MDGLDEREPITEQGLSKTFSESNLQIKSRSACAT